MDGSSSAPEPRQVSAMSCRFAGPTSGTVARAYSSLDSPCNRLALVCRLRNIVDDLLREPLKDKPQLQLPGRLMAATCQIMFSRYQQTVRSAEQPTVRCHDALPGADCVRCP